MIRDVASGMPVALCVMGTTASGKTDLALALAERLDCEIISVDSAQVYRGMDIGTAKPSPAILERHPHRLVDIRDPAETYSAAEFRGDALEAIQTIIDGGRTPLLVGGTMLYFRVLREGLSELPAASPAARSAIDTVARRAGWREVHRRLRAVDPIAAARIHPNDPQRLQRALEVYMVSGRPLSHFHASERGRNALPCRLLQIGLAPRERGALHARIVRRLDSMLEAGFVEEVRALHARGDLTRTLASIRSVGYLQLWDFLSDRLSYREARERAIIATRQLAKRQLTWLRSWPELHWIETAADAGDAGPGDAGDVVEAALKILARATI